MVHIVKAMLLFGSHDCLSGITVCHFSKGEYADKNAFPPNVACHKITAFFELAASFEAACFFCHSLCMIRTALIVPRTRKKRSGQR